MPCAEVDEFYVFGRSTHCYFNGSNCHVVARCCCLSSSRPIRAFHFNKSGRLHVLASGHTHTAVDTQKMKFIFMFALCGNVCLSTLSNPYQPPAKICCRKYSVCGKNENTFFRHRLLARRQNEIKSQKQKGV